MTLPNHHCNRERHCKKRCIATSIVFGRRGGEIAGSTTIATSARKWGEGIFDLYLLESSPATADPELVIDATALDKPRSLNALRRHVCRPPKSNRSHSQPHESTLLQVKPPSDI